MAKDKKISYINSMRKFFSTICNASNFLTRSADGLSHFAVLGIRCYLAKIFLWSAWLKINSWSTTVYMFTHEFKVDYMSPEVAAYLGTATEILFPFLLLIGLCARLSALSLFVFNLVSVLSYSILLTPEYACALKDHVLWGVLALIPFFYGPGKISVDYLLQQKVCSNYRY